MPPVIATARSTASPRSSPAAWAWQVSKQKPISTLVSAASTASQSFASASKRRATALSPPAVFSRYTGTSDSSISSVRVQRPTPSSIPSSAWPGWTITASAPIAAAASQVWVRIFREP